MASNKNYRLLEKVVGYENRKNDLLLFANSSRNKIVYYFGGDIQVDMILQSKKGIDGIMIRIYQNKWINREKVVDINVGI